MKRTSPSSEGGRAHSPLTGLICFENFSRTSLCSSRLYWTLISDLG